LMRAASSTLRRKFASAIRDLSFERDAVCRTSHGLCVNSQSSGSSGSHNSSSPWLQDQRRLSARSTRVSKPSTSDLGQIDWVWSGIFSPTTRSPDLEMRRWFELYL